MPQPSRRRARAPRQPAMRRLWEESLRDVAMRREWQLAQGRRRAGRGSRAGLSTAGYAWLMLIAFALALGWLNRDLVMPQVTTTAEAASLALADSAAQARTRAQSAALADDPYAYADAPQDMVSTADAATISFGLCHTGGGRNCVVDGDTFWLNGEKIRIADIDTPETHPPRCAREAELGERATLRLQHLLSAGPITLAPAASGDNYDRYGRRLAVVERSGASIGMMLVSEGLARAYAGGQRAGWC